MGKALDASEHDRRKKGKGLLGFFRLGEYGDPSIDGRAGWGRKNEAKKGGFVERGGGKNM